MTWREIISKTGTYLDAKGVPDASLAAELLAARLLKIGRGFLAPHLGAEAGEAHVAAMRRAMARLVKNEPIQYVLGEWDFRSLTLKCDRRALIPRPETEELVSHVLAFLRARGKKTASVQQQVGGGPEETASVRQQDLGAPVVIDVGTGTGAIVLALAKEYEGEATFIGSDVSEEAIALAQTNARLTGLADRVKLVVMDGLDELDEPQCLDVIVSNPPYIESAVCETLDPRVKNFEPRLALDGGAEGLDFYDRYLADALNLLKPGGAVFFEIGESQGEAVRDLLAGYGFSAVRIEKDLAGHDRYAMGVMAQ